MPKPPVATGRRRSRHGALLVVVALVALLATPAGGQSLDEARQERRVVQTRLDRAARDLAAIEDRVAALEADQARLEAQRAELESNLSAANTRIEQRVRELYKRGTADPVMLLMGGSEPTEAVDRAITVQRLVAGDRLDAEAATATRIQLGVVAERLAEREQTLATVRARHEGILDDLAADLRRAQRLEDRLEAEAAARARAARRAAAQRASGRAAVAASGGRACPIGRPHSFTDTWGAPRGGGRTHQGVDMLAPRGVPIRAIVSGTWDIYPYGGSAGNWAILRGSDGNQYWYMHLQSHTVGDGARVSAGQQTGTNGDTGNARGTPHLHFEYHPGGGGPVNPYPLVRGLC